MTVTETEFAGKVAWVTGAARGIGRDVASRLAAAGATVYGSDLSEGDGSQTIRQRQLDVKDRHGCAMLVDEIQSEHGRLDIVVANAGVCPPGQAVGEPEQWDEVLAVNIGGTRNTVAAAWPVMEGQQSGAIVLVSSAAYYQGGLTVGTEYSTSKAAIVGMTRHLARNGGPLGIRVNAVAPGLINTAMIKDMSLPDPSKIPLGRFGEAREVGGPIVFLCSENASYMTGTVINITGGMVLAG